MNETKTRILDAAERLLGEHGLDVSLRTITAEAGVNLAAVNYHFQSKEALIDAVIGRRLEPINRRRLEMLDAAEREAGDAPVPLEKILEAFLGPVIEVDQNGFETFRPLVGKVYSMPKAFLEKIFARHLAHIAARFGAALAAVLPELTAEERTWRLHFSIGVMVHVINWWTVVPAVSHGVLDVSDSKAVLDRVIAFTAAGIRAPAVNLSQRPAGNLSEGRRN